MGADISSVYSKPFFELQLALARKIADLLQQPLEQAVLQRTAFYRILGLDWSLDPTNPIWQSYVQGLQGRPADIDYTYQFYLQRLDKIPTFAAQEHWGCFAYDYNTAAKRMHFHFGDQDTSPYSALSHQRINARKSELQAMFTIIQRRHPDAELVIGGSWLYNWDAYKRLFPPIYGQSTYEDKVVALIGRNIWGQFLRRNGQVHRETMELFLQRVSQLERTEDYPQCFPYPSLHTQAPIQAFYTFYGIA